MTKFIEKNAAALSDYKVCVCVFTQEQKDKMKPGGSSK